MFHSALLSFNLLQDQSCPGCGALISVSCQSLFHCCANASSINHINLTEMYMCSVKACHSCSERWALTSGGLYYTSFYFINAFFKTGPFKNNNNNNRTAETTHYLIQLPLQLFKILYGKIILIIIY